MKETGKRGSRGGCQAGRQAAQLSENPSRGYERAISNTQEPWEEPCQKGGDDVRDEMERAVRDGARGQTISAPVH